MFAAMAGGCRIEKYGISFVVVNEIERTIVVTRIIDEA